MPNEVKEFVCILDSTIYEMPIECRYMDISQNCQIHLPKQVEKESTISMFEVGLCLLTSS